MIRNAKKEDLERILEIYAPYITEQTVSFEYDVPTMEEFTKRFEGITSFYPWIVLEVEGKIVGYAYLSRAFERKAYRFIADLSVYLDQNERGKGYGRILVEEIEKRAKDMNIVMLYSLITGENTASVAFHEAMGFTYMATFPDSGYKFGKWLSVFWYQKRLSEGEPKELEPYKE